VVVSANRPIVPADLVNAQNQRQSFVVDQLLPFRAARELFRRDYFANLLCAAKSNLSEAARQSRMSAQSLRAYFIGLA
jgi:hypothetical protein